MPLSQTNLPPGKNLNLPETACISLQGLNPIPAIFTGSDDPSFHWATDVVVDSQHGTIDLDAGSYDSTAQILWSTVVDVLITRCAFPPRNILFLGYGQGAMPALLLAASRSDLEFGGLVSIGGRLPSSAPAGKSKTPVLVCGGARSEQVTRSALDALRSSFGDVEYVKWDKADDSMPANREEMLPIMRFLARRLQSRAGVPEGAVEV
jgi:predicted esterase